MTEQAAYWPIALLLWLIAGLALAYIVGGGAALGGQDDPRRAR